MMDPMANLDGGSAPGASSNQSTKDVFDPIALTYNLKQIDNIRSFMGIVSGCVAGIFGLTGLQGLGKYHGALSCIRQYRLVEPRIESDPSFACLTQSLVLTGAA